MNVALSQSTLDPAGRGAEVIADLFWVMAIGGVCIWLLVIGLAVYAILRPGKHQAKTTRVLVIGGGAVFPTLVLTGLLTYGLSILPDLQSPAPQGSQVVEVVGVRWWWRVRYRLPSGKTVETANEIHLPVGEAVEFKLTSEDVIHSFWIPALGGKMDMIPGRENRLKLFPTKTGVFRGVCAEFCGAAHAQMSFDVVVQSRDEFDRWLVELQQSAGESDHAGQAVFRSRGCGACHTIRGTEFDGVVGPDLTHFGSRRSIGASVLANTPENLTRWISHTHQVKPGVEMPAFDSIDAEKLAELVDYLMELR
ncbi:cytochrome c oxidase subunit II [Stieleria varia]|uniref:Cytochrome aa3 subunit 2 n=1 Tax=Stieleria varia TaxID=2528005 RepID=A0A5C6AZJ2_9BACT|nr:cytochrome c oxidase subunit II [Stieleria varia]TWU04937.1 Cytochrome c oxidase subunit 2 precursor [Stieleria varia]